MNNVVVTLIIIGGGAVEIQGIRSYYELISEGERKEADHESVSHEGEGALYRSSFDAGGYSFEIEDLIEDRSDVPGIRISRKIHGTPLDVKREYPDGIMFALSLPMDTTPDCKWRFCSPTIDLTKPRKMIYKKRMYNQNEEAIGNIFGAYNCDTKTMYSIYRCTDTARKIVKEYTLRQQQRHEEDMAALGYEVTGRDQLELIISWPMTTEFYLLDGSEINVGVEYTTIRDQAPTFADGVYAAYKNLLKEVINLTRGPLRQERLEHLEQTKKRLKENHTHLEGGCESFYGRSDVIGYGLNERNLRIALFMAINCGGEWMDTAERMVEFYVNHCTASSGFAWTKFDLRTMEPVSDFDGNYVLPMTQALYDVFMAYKDFRRRGINKPAWLESTRKFADFLVRVQNSDGSWYHAYDMDGNEADAPNLDKVRPQIKDASRKTGAEVPLCFLSRLVMYLESIGLNADDYRKSALECAEYVLKNIIRFEMYLGGDPEYPSAPDKDAARYTLMGLYNVYKMSGDRKYLDGAVTAAKLFVVWNNRDYPCDCIELYKLGMEIKEEIFIVSTYYAYMDFDIEDL